jgi:hypothetical protein
MYRVRWVIQRQEAHSVEEETSVHGDLDVVVASCIERFSEVRLKHPQNPPEGFLVFDETGQEVQRWFGSGGPDV